MAKSFPRTVFLWLRRHFRQATALLMVAALVVTSLGLAVPLPIQKDTSELYPCMDCSCGCVNAEMCWRDCCCHTNAEKVAWARENGVIPPVFVLAAAKQESACCGKEAATPSCCSKKKVASCCHAKQTCAREEVAESEGGLTWRTPRKTDKRGSSLVLLQALKCQGLSSSWTLLPPTVVPVDFEVDYSPTWLNGQVVLENHSFTGQLPPPDLPPPENAV